ncbi:uncharacterized protein EDB91DRAFT_1060319, partial [Suillus paluster]|uniref:uncharacterized protein n=1 Tax=Suillus paluster TaxID=48578 RepID=UPI001B881CE6
QSSGLWYQKGLLTSELHDLFVHAPPAPNSVINQCAREAYARATGTATASSEGRCHAPGPEDDCPICYESMHGADGNTLIWCETCSNKATVSEGYINLSAIAGFNQEHDTSSCASISTTSNLFGLSPHSPFHLFS